MIITEAILQMRYGHLPASILEAIIDDCLPKPQAVQSVRRDCGTRFDVAPDKNDKT